MRRRGKKLTLLHGAERFKGGWGVGVILITCFYFYKNSRGTGEGEGGECDVSVTASSVIFFSPPRVASRFTSFLEQYQSSINNVDLKGKRRSRRRNTYARTRPMILKLITPSFAWTLFSYPLNPPSHSV